MRIDELFKCIDENISKEYYYIGRTTQIFPDCIYIQFENLNVSSSRILVGDYIQPSNIKEYVIIDNYSSLLVGRIEQIKLKDSDNVHQSLNQADDEAIYPTAKIQIIGTISNDIQNDIQVDFGSFIKPTLTTKVYACPNKIVNKINSNLYRINPRENSSISFGDLYNGDEFNIAIDDLYQQHLMIVGSTNSGKSTTALSIIEKSIQKRVKYLILDPTGEYSESFNNKENVCQYTLGKDFCVDNGYIRIKQWCDMFSANDSSQPASLDKAIRTLKKQHNVYEYAEKTPDTVEKDLNENSSEYEYNNFDISLLAEQMRKQSVDIKNNKYVYSDFKLSTNLYLIDKIELMTNNTNFMSIFNDSDQTDDSKNTLQEVLKEFYTNDNKSLYIDCSKINDINVASTFISILIDTIFNDLFNKDDNKITPFVLYLDEAHRYMLNKSSKESLVKIAREGRKYGIFMSLTSQSPNDVPEILLGQIGTFIIHRLSHAIDIQTMMNFTKDKVCLQYLAQGDAILSSVHLKQDIQLCVNKSNIKHKNNTPSLLDNTND